jgi:diguanylate cyclase (GGDEF)-like protein
MVLAGAMGFSAGWLAVTALGGVLLLAVAAGFVAGVWCAPALQERAVRRAARHIQRMYELTVSQLDAAGRMCRLLGDFPAPELSTTQWERLEQTRTQLLDAWRTVAERQSPQARLEQTEPGELSFQVAWQRSPVDSATQLPDRSAFDANLGLMLSEAQKFNRPCGLLLVRMDKCDALQRRYGADVLVKLQSRLATLVIKSVRDDDLVCRLQPDVFGVLLPAVSPIAGARIAEAVRSAVREHRFRVEETGQEYLATASFGYACGLPTEPATLLMDRAGEALAKSQVLGRNQLHVHDGAQRTAIRVG